MTADIALNPTRLAIAAAVGLVFLLVVIIRFKVQAMIAILIGAITIGLAAGMPAEEIVTAVTEYGTQIHASVEQGNVFACQFHPEKSSDAGIQILKNFVAV